MATLTSILATDIVADSRSTINTNFQNLNAQTVRLYLTNTQSILTSVLTNATGISLPLQLNEVWAIRVIALYNSPTVPDIKFSFSGPVSTNLRWIDDSTSGITISSIGSLIFSGGGAGDRIFVGSGTVTTGSVAGNLQLQWAQSIDSVSSITTLLQSTNIIATKLN